MKKIILVLTFVVAFIVISNAQDSISSKHRIYKVTATTTDPTVKGYLASVADSSIFISSNAIRFKGYRISNVNYSKMNKINFADLDKVRLRRQGSTGRGLLKGAIVGVLGGTLLGSITYTKPKDDIERVLYILSGLNRTTYTIAIGMYGGLGGAIVGSVVGDFAHKTFIIGGRKEKFDAMKSKIIN